MPFCTSCGKELAEGEVCSCQQAAPKAEEVKKEVKPEAKKEVKAEAKKDVKAAPAQEAPAKKKSVLPIVIIVAVLVLAAVIAVLVLTSKSYLKPLDKYVALINEKNPDYREYQYALMSDSRVKAAKKLAEANMAKDTYKNLVEDTTDAWEKNFERCDDELDAWTFSYEVKSKEKIEEDELQDLQKSCERYYRDNIKDQIEDIEDILDDKDDLEDDADDADIEVKEMKAIYKAQVDMLKGREKAEITKGYEVKIKFTLEGEDDTYKSENVKIRIVKMNGDWVYAGITDESIALEKDMFYFIVSYLNNSYLNY